ncbi:MAG: hypothetical protein K8H84_03385 [Sulfuricella denitrificans]|nr:hypothetical protein [Sulfuricella denitrificans]
MEKIAIENTTKMPIYVAGQMIPAGEIRHFNEDQVPAEYRPAKEEEPKAEMQVADPLTDILKGNVKDVVAALNGMLFADIDRLGDLEQQGQARKGILSAIAEIQLSQAANADLLAKVDELSDEALADALVEAGTDVNIDPDYVAALEVEFAKRKAG